MTVSKNQVHLSQYNMKPPFQAVPHKVIICDVTLREGDQSPGVAMSIDDKIELSKSLDAIGVGQIQLGRPKTPDALKEARALSKMKRNFKLEIMSFGNSATWKEEVRLSIDLGADIVHTNLVMSPYTKQMFPSMDDTYVDRALAIVEYAREKGAKEINFSFPDATRTPMNMLEKVIKPICRAGVERIRIADSAGTVTPRGMFYLTSWINKLVEGTNTKSLFIIGIHCHNDLGLATANAVAGVEAGAQLIDLAVNGLGERAGNADFAEVVTILETVYAIDTGIRLDLLTDISKKVETITKRPVPTYKPITGCYAFSDQEGKHIDAYLKNPYSFQGFKPEMVGNKRVFLLGKLSEETIIKVKLKELDLNFPDERITLLKDKIASLSYKKKGSVISDKEFRKIVLKTIKT